MHDTRTKDELKEHKVELLQRLERAPTEERAGIQAEITIVNAQIKAINVSEQAAARAKSLERKARGRAVHQSDLARAIAANVPASQRPRHLGEDVMIAAKRLRGMLSEIPKDRQQPFTAAFVVQLDAFLAGQRDYLKAFNKRLSLSARSEEAEWASTWEVKPDELPCECPNGAHPNHRNMLEGGAERDGRVCELGWPIPH